MITLEKIFEEIHERPIGVLQNFLITFIFINVVFLVLRLIKYLLSSNKHQALVNKGKKVMLERDEKLDIFYNKYKNEVTNIRQEEILSLSASELCIELKAKKVTSRETVITYGLRIATIGKDLKIIADVDLDRSLSEAEKADEIIRKTKDSNDLPLLIGLPICIKDYIKVKDLLGTVGMLVHAFKKDDENAYVVDLLISKGAIVICKGNVPQGLMALESSNRVYGTAENPWDRKRTPGGSSGGDAAIVATKCAPISIGSDIGGSIRNPANFCGIYGFKPTSNKISNSKAKVCHGGNYDGFEKILPSIGPISSSIDDIVLILTALFGEFPKDHFSYRSKFDEKSYYSLVESVNSDNKNKKRLRIGYSYNAERVELAKGITTEIKNAIDKLKKEGHEVVEFPYNDFLYIHDHGLQIMFNSGTMPSLFKSLKDEKPMNFYDSVKLLIGTPSWLFKILGFIMRIAKQGRLADYLKHLKRYKNLNEYFDSCAKFNEERDRFYDKYREMKLDCLILPVQPFPALYNGLADISSQNVFYTMTLNYLNMPSGSIPLGLLKDNTYTTKYNDKMAEVISDSVKNSLNLPIGIQVATLPLEDEKCIAMMKIIDDVVRKDKEKEYKDFIKSKDCPDDRKELLKGFLLHNKY